MAIERDPHTGPATAAPLGVGATEHEVGERSMAVLVVDDSAYMRELLRAMLRSLGIEHVHDADGVESAIRVLKGAAVDVVIVDWVMEPLDGLELVQRLRRSEQSPNPFIPIIMATGHTEAARVVEARDLGVTEFLAKPLSARQVARRLDEIIHRPRPFVRADCYFGPDRRRRQQPLKGEERRRTAPLRVDVADAAA
jgi:CheY-like chemotaxis protein